MQDVSIRISVAGAAEAPLIADISRRTFYDTFAPYNTAENMEQFLGVQFTRQQLIAEVGAPRNTFLLAWLGEVPAGYARLYDGQELPRDLAGTSAIEISRIYCEQEMIGACLNVGRQKGKEWIWLCVWEHNQRAIRFYEKIGFERFGQCVFLLGQDVQNDWCMKKRI
jgi:diamine N-acetyltransferase